VKLTLRYLFLVLAWFGIGGTIIWLGIRFEHQIASLLCAGAVLLPAAWLVLSALSPAKGDMKCPKCGAEALRRLNKQDILGVHCGACGFEDPEMYRPYLDEMA